MNAPRYEDTMQFRLVRAIQIAGNGIGSPVLSAIADATVFLLSQSASLKPEQEAIDPQPHHFIRDVDRKTFSPQVHGLLEKCLRAHGLLIDTVTPIYQAAAQAVADALDLEEAPRLRSRVACLEEDLRNATEAYINAFAGDSNVEETIATVQRRLRVSPETAAQLVSVHPAFRGQAALKKDALFCTRCGHREHWSEERGMRCGIISGSIRCDCPSLSKNGEPDEETLALCELYRGIKRFQHSQLIPRPGYPVIEVELEEWRELGSKLKQIEVTIVGEVSRRAANGIRIKLEWKKPA